MDLLTDFLTSSRIANLLRAVAILLLGILIARVVRAGFDRFIAHRVPSQRALLRRAVWYGMLFLVLATTLRQLGFDLSVLLGAAGILTVAIGFASQTSASNLISGIFLLTEQPFRVGDVITVGTTTGEVLSVDLISVKLRTFDNLLVRLPNEMLLKSQITNLTHFPIRRVDILVSVHFESSIDRVKALVLGVVATQPVAMDEPSPAVYIKAVGPWTLDLQISAWAATANVSSLREGLQAELHRALAPYGQPPYLPAPGSPEAPATTAGGIVTGAQGAAAVWPTPVKRGPA